MIATWILIFVISTSNNGTAGAAAITQEFTSKDKCLTAARLLQQQARERQSHVLITVCAEK